MGKYYLGSSQIWKSFLGDTYGNLTKETAQIPTSPQYYMSAQDASSLGVSGNWVSTNNSRFFYISPSGTTRQRTTSPKYVRLDGTSGLVYSPVFEEYMSNGTTDLTFGGWFRVLTADPPSVKFIFNRGQDYTSGGTNFFRSSVSWFFRFGDRWITNVVADGVGNELSLSLFSTNIWYHLAVSIDLNNQYKSYVNGQLAGTDSSLGSALRGYVDQPWLLGNWQGTSGNEIGYTNMDIGEFGCWFRALSDDDVTNWYNATKNIYV